MALSFSHWFFSVYSYHTSLGNYSVENCICYCSSTQQFMLSFYFKLRTEHCWMYSVSFFNQFKNVSLPFDGRLCQQPFINDHDIIFLIFGYHFLVLSLKLGFRQPWEKFWKSEIFYIVAGFICFCSQYIAYIWYSAVCCTYYDYVLVWLINKIIVSYVLIDCKVVNEISIQIDDVWNKCSWFGKACFPDRVFDSLWMTKAFLVVYHHQLFIKRNWIEW